MVGAMPWVFTAVVLGASPGAGAGATGTAVRGGISAACAELTGLSALAMREPRLAGAAAGGAGGGATGLATGLAGAGADADVGAGAGAGATGLATELAAAGTGAPPYICCPVITGCAARGGEVGGAGEGATACGDAGVGGPPVGAPGTPPYICWADAGAGEPGPGPPYICCPVIGAGVVADGPPYIWDGGVVVSPDGGAAPGGDAPLACCCWSCSGVITPAPNADFTGGGTAGAEAAAGVAAGGAAVFAPAPSLLGSNTGPIAGLELSLDELELLGSAAPPSVIGVGAAAAWSVPADWSVAAVIAWRVVFWRWSAWMSLLPFHSA